ncbi:type II toxin-antitoxin system death-on-curing family toxin [Agromyces sp. NPDC058484]|uniref:type II toxin-antitoxin system death-on-curing family toxin n=1 Tax=Agromyces sp. NPDC058484 TaxID=3346524 RepID=UPI003666F62E
MREYLDPVDVEAWVSRRGLHVRDRALLLSALAAPLPVFDEEVYPDLHEKAAVLLIAINRNHPLLDGNKRLSWLVTAAFYELNGYDLAVDPQSDIDVFVRGIAAGQTDVPETATWLAAHTSPLDS